MKEPGLAFAGSKVARGMQLSSAVAAILAVAGVAQAASAPALEEIIVTAERRATSEQTTAISMDVLTSDTLAESRTQTINDLPSDIAGAMPFKAIDVLAVAPSQSLDALAQEFTSELPPAIRHAMGALGVLKGSGGTLASYLLFEPRFVQALIAMGERDARALKDELLALFSGT